MKTFLACSRAALASVVVALVLYLLLPFVAVGFVVVGYALDIDVVTALCGSVANSTNAAVDDIGQYVVANRGLRIAVAILAVPVTVAALIDVVAEVVARSRWAE